MANNMHANQATRRVWPTIGSESCFSCLVSQAGVQLVQQAGLWRTTGQQTVLALPQIGSIIVCSCGHQYALQSHVADMPGPHSACLPHHSHAQCCNLLTLRLDAGKPLHTTVNMCMQTIVTNSQHMYPLSGVDMCQVLFELNMVDTGSIRGPV